MSAVREINYIHYPTGMLNRDTAAFKPKMSINPIKE